MVSSGSRERHEWSEAKCAGFALAALIAGDRDLSAADEIPASAAVRTRALVAHQVDHEPRNEQARRQVVERLLSAVRPEIALSERMPLRVRALLASRLPRAEARALGLPSPRAGFTVAEDLWPRLYRIARYYRGMP
jgi:hypothetical protein